MSNNELYVTRLNIINGYRITIPKEVCDQLGIGIGHLVNITVDTQDIDHEPLVANEERIGAERRIAIKDYRFIVRGLSIGDTIDLYIEPTGKTV